MTQEQYECLVRLLSRPSYSCEHVYWTMLHTPYEWHELIKGRGHQLIWPLSYMWLGALKLGLMNEGLDSAVEFYQSILGVFLSIRGRQFVKESSVPVPLSYLVFTHLGSGEFRVTYKRKLIRIYTTTSNRKKFGVEASNISCVSSSDDVERRWKWLIQSINTTSNSMPAISLSSKPLEFLRKKKFLSLLSVELDKALEQEQGTIV